MKKNDSQSFIVTRLTTLITTISFFGWVYLFIFKKFKNFGGRQSKVHFSLLREQDLHSRCSGCCTHTVCNILSRKCEFNSPGLTLAEYESSDLMVLQIQGNY